MSFAIQTQGLCRAFGNIVAVDDLDLEVPAGTVFGFLGPNGAGKTTTIRMLLGLIAANAGEIRLNGHSITTDRHGALTGVGAIVDTPALYPNLTGFETLQMAAHLQGQSRDEIEKRLDQVGLIQSAFRRVREYSLGMRQRLALARAMLGDPKLLILDEPTNGLDPAGIADMRELIRTAPERLGASVFLSSHLLSEIEQTASHCALVDDGRLMFQGGLKDLAARLPAELIVECDRPTRLVQRFLDAEILAHREGDCVRAEVQLDPGERADLLAALLSEGYAVSGLWTERPTLERAFLRFTGRGRERLQ